MPDRILVLRPDDPVSFVADACAALADAVNEVRVVRSTDEELVATYAELVVAYSRGMREQLTAEGTARLAVIDHLVDRLRQAQAGEITLPVLDVVDRLHAELTRETVFG